jgi:hypothetical protein
LGEDKTLNYSYGKDVSFSVSHDTLVQDEKTLDPIFKKTVDDSDIYISELLDVNYEIYNSESETIYDLEIFFPQQADVDQVIMEDTNNFNSYFVADSLDSGEKIILSGVEKIRPKINESVLRFKDSSNKLFFAHSNSGIINVKEGYTQGALIFLDKNYSYNEGEDLINIILNVENFGDSSANIDLFDNSMNWSFSLDSGKKKKVVYSFVPIYNFFETPNAYINYNSLNKDIRSYSKKVVINISRPIDTITNSSEESEIVEDEELTDLESEGVKEEVADKEKDKSFKGFIKFLLSKIFGD